MDVGFRFKIIFPKAGPEGVLEVVDQPHLKPLSKNKIITERPLYMFKITNSHFAIYAGKG